MMEWEMKEWNDVLTIKNGKSQKKVVNPEGKYPIYGSGGVMGYATDYLCKENTTIIGRKGSINNPIYVTEKFWNVDTAFGLEVGNSLDNKFFYYFCTTYNFLKHNKATTLPSLTKSDLLKIKIPLPPLAEQKRIAAILDAADEVRQKNKALIEKYNQLTQSLFLDMFGDPVTNPKGWEKKPMSELMTIVRGGSPRPIQEFLGGNNPWIKIGDATKGDDIYLHDTKEKIIDAGLTKTRLLPEGSLIFANCGVSLGFARIIKIQGCIHDGWLAFSEFDEEVLDKIFLLKSLNSVTKYFRDTAPDGTQPNLNTAIMKKYQIILPPIKLQREFVKALGIATEQKNQAEASLKKSEDLFNALLQKAFKGELLK